MKQRNREGLIFLYCLFVATVCLLICSKSSPLYPINDWTDANAYLSSGKGMLAGRVMYRDLYEHKGPLLYALHALCCMIDSTSFSGVFLMEALAGGLFLLAAYRLLTLYGAKRSALVVLPLIAMVIYTSFSFQQGDSAEELCMPMLLWSLYELLRWLRLEAPLRMKPRLLVLNGILCGCVLWVKFTMLGFFVPWMLGILLYHFVKHESKASFAALGWFLGGIAIATLPWIVYFGINGSIIPWLKTYLYDNIFLYQDEPALGLFGRAKAMMSSGWDWFTVNLTYTVPLAFGMLWFTFRRHKPSTMLKEANGMHENGDKPARQPEDRRDESATVLPWTISFAEKAFIWAMLLMAALGVFIGGKSYVYYGLILSVFVVLGAVPVCRWLDGLIRQNSVLWPILLCITVLGTVIFCLTTSPNRGDLLKPRAETMQYQFAAIVNQTPDATLLNYGFMDAGFYTACNVAPSVKYFHQTNVHLQEMLDEQIRYITDGVTDYVVTRGKQPNSIVNHYELVATADAPAGFWYQHVFLYRRKGLTP